MNEREVILLRKEQSMQIAFLRNSEIIGFPKFHVIQAPVFHSSYEGFIAEIRARDLQQGQIIDKLTIRDEGPIALMFFKGGETSAENVIQNRAGRGNVHGYIVLCETASSEHRYTLVGIPLDSYDALRGNYPFQPRSFNR